MDIELKLFSSVCCVCGMWITWDAVARDAVVYQEKMNKAMAYVDNGKTVTQSSELQDGPGSC